MAPATAPNTGIVWVASFCPNTIASRGATVALWNKVETCDDAKWTERYHTSDPEQKAFGGRVEITMANGEVLVDEMAVANAHSLGATPWQRPDYIKKFKTLTDGIVSEGEADRFLSAVQNLESLKAGELSQIHVAADLLTLPNGSRDELGIF